MRRGRYLRDVLLGSVCSALCRPLDWRVSPIHGFAHLVHKGGRCLREEENVDQMLVPLLCSLQVADLLFDPTLFAGEGRLQPDVIFSAAWFLHYSSRSGLMNFYRAGTYWR